jgi:CRISPR-associated protein (TIGR03986 family)
MNPKHIDEVPEFIQDDKGKELPRRAVAPYNFVELPEKIVPAEDLPSGDRYHLERHTGRIECSLTTESPLYIRCGLTTEEFQTGKETKDLPDFFYTDPASKSEKPVLPGSSLRGMLRTLVEIVSFSKIERVSAEHRLFFRAVASNPEKESWGKEYKKYVKSDKVKAGYLKKDNKGWYIQPAKAEQGATFAWVRETTLNLPNFNNFNGPQYEPQYISVSYSSVVRDKTDRAKRLFAHNVDLPNIHLKKGVLVTSGNMKQGNEPSPRRNHCIVFECLVFEANSTSPKLRLDDKAIEHYRNALTDFQKESPFDKDWGVLVENRPVFYCPPEKGKNIVGFFGQSPNFRIPYSPEGNGHATTVVNFVPENLRKLASIDLADAIFGWVKKETKDEKLPDGFDKQRAGRVFFTDGLYQSSQNGIWYQDKPLTPQILSEPKPSNFPHYLVQPSADKSELKHYASQPITETVIRGHKLYWHKGSKPDFKLKKVIDASKKVSDTQTTLIKPINQGVTFKFNIFFENLTKVELGALLWVLDIAQDDRYRLKLGMGKPLGLGAVKIKHKLYLSDRKKRYTQLFRDNSHNWETAETLETAPNYKQCFENYMLEELQHAGKFEDICRIQMLLEMLRWEEKPSQKYLEQRRYMEIERQQRPRLGNDNNEYKEHPVLPNPLDVMGIKIECDRPSPSLQKKSPTQPTQHFLEGQDIDAKVIDIQVQEGKKLKTTIIYEIQGSDCPAKEEIHKQKVSFAVGDIVKVTIVKVQGKNVRKVKHL